ncbi:MAG: hypothetical protein LUG98_16415 [Tannerellaceae bacterium]|nr:hypothetical protein [Tannerellaceae bacterium]
MKKLFISVFLLCLFLFSSVGCNSSQKKNTDENVDKMKESLHDEKENLEDAWDAGVDYTKEKWDETKDAVRGKADNAKEDVRDTYQDLKDDENKKQNNEEKTSL